MSDLVTTMLALRDRKGWQLADTLIRQAARDPNGTVESLETRFRYAGVPQPPAVLAQLVQLRTEAQQAGEVGATDQDGRPGSSAEPGDGGRPEGTAWKPPAWYRPARDDEPEPVPEAPVLNLVSSNPEEPTRDDDGPPQWFRDLRARESAAVGDPAPVAESSPPPPAATQPPSTTTASPGRGRHSSWPEPPPAARTPMSTRPPAFRTLTDDDLPDLAQVSVAWDAFAQSTATLQAAVDGAGRCLAHWDPSSDAPGRTTVYLVCGSPHAVPEGPESDRQMLTTANQVVLPDESIRFLAVFAYSVGSAAELADAVAVRHAVGRVLLEVQDLQVEPAEHGVLLSWTRPTGVERVRVMRSLPGRPLPTGPDPSLQVRFNGDTFRDADVEPGATYSYRVYTEARTLGQGDDSVESSSGLIRTVTVPGRPDAVTDLRAGIRLRERRPGVSVGWTRPRRGESAIYLLPGEPDGDTVLGTTLVEAQWDVQEPLLGRRVREPTTRDDDLESIAWMPLDTHVDGGRHSQWTVTVVTEFSGSWIIGAQVPVLYVGDIEELEIEERVDSQLIRSTWPTGATFLGVWIVSPGDRSHGAPPHSFNRQQFDEHGGVVLTLPPTPVDVLIQGYTRYARENIRGGQFRIPYQGRWVVHYQLPPVGRFSSGRSSLQLAVDRPGWPNLSFMLIGDTEGFPLRTDGPGAREICRGELPGTALVPGQYVTANPEVRIPRDVHTRLLAWTSMGATTLVLDPLGPPVDPPPAPPIPDLRCPRCLRISDLSVQHFRCQGSCEREPDPAMTELLHPGSSDPAHAVEDLPVFASVRPRRVERRTEVVDPPQNSATCPRCAQPSQRHVCPHCHSDLPPNWWSYDVLGVVLVGARYTGKTTYLSALVGHLERRLLPAIGGHLYPIDPESQTKLEEHRAGLRVGKLAGGTQGAAGNEQLLRPMVASIGPRPNGRNRALAMFDVAGEDMSTAETVRPYAPALAGSDLVMILIDPLQLDGIRDWVRGVVPLPGKGDPTATVVTNVVQEIRRLRGPATGRLPLRAAVVFAKFDGMQAAARAPQSPMGRLIGPGNALWRDPYVTSGRLYDEPDGRRMHDEVRALLLAMNERSLVKLVEDSFQQVRYFALSALGHGPRGRQLTDAGASPQRVGDPLRWLLWSARWES